MDRFLSVYFSFNQRFSDIYLCLRFFKQGIRKDKTELQFFSSSFKQRFPDRYLVLRYLNKVSRIGT